MPSRAGKLRGCGEAHAIEVEAMSRVAIGAVALFVLVGCEKAVAPSGALVSHETSITSVAVDEGFVYYTAIDAVKRASLDDGHVEIVAPDQKTPQFLQIDKANVFWVAGDVVNVAPKAGGKSAVLATGSNVSSVALDDAHVFYTNLGEGSLRSVAKTGGASTALVTNLAAPQALAPLVLTTVYWGQQSQDSAVLSVPSQGGDTTTVAASPFVPHRTTTDGSTVYWTAQGAASGLTPDQTTPNGLVYSATADGTVTVLATTPISDGNASAPNTNEGQPVPTVADPDDIVVAGNNVYWSSLDGSVSVVDAQGLTTPQVIASSADSSVLQSVHLATDGAALYVANEAEGDILVLPLGEISPPQSSDE